MKKMTLVLALALILSLVGCGQTEEPEEDDGSYWLSGYLLSSEKDKSG
ncbi:MAG: hypothetical protein J6M63_08240 [Pseudobutyrivibrio sp.]|nr:hypothetical protein [Pseudobutyrivibrio sp.]